MTVPAVFSRLHVTLLPLYGNPDVFLNTNGVRPIAGGSASYGSSFYIGTDQIEVLYNDAVVRASCRVSQRPGASCTFNIGIYGADFSGYALIASIDGEITARVVLAEYVPFFQPHTSCPCHPHSCRPRHPPRVRLHRRRVRPAQRGELLHARSRDAGRGRRLQLHGLLWAGEEAADNRRGGEGLQFDGLLWEGTGGPSVSRPSLGR